MYAGSGGRKEARFCGDGQSGILAQDRPKGRTRFAEEEGQCVCVCVCVYVCLCAKIWVPTSMGPFGRLFFDKLFEFHCIKCCQVLLSEDTVLSIHGYDSISTFDLLGLGSSEVPFPDATSHNLLL